jgi:hypothetical protein
VQEATIPSAGEQGGGTDNGVRWRELIDTLFDIQHQGQLCHLLTKVQNLESQQLARD